MRDKFDVTNCLHICLAGLFLLIPQLCSGDEVQSGCSTEGARAVTVNQRLLLMREDGKILTKKEYCRADEFSDGLILFEVCGKDDHSTFEYLTPKGKVALTVNAEYARRFSEGLAPIQNAKTHLWGYIDKMGKTVIEPKFEIAGPFSDGLALVQVKIGEGWTFIDKNGATVLMPPQFENYMVTDVHDFKSGAAVIVFGYTIYDFRLFGLIDRSGKWLVKPTAELLEDLVDGVIPFWSTSTHKMRFMDRNGRVVVEPQFTGMSWLPFEEGLAAVDIGDGPNKKVGFIDNKGHWVIPPKFDAAYHFCGGLAAVEVHGLWGFINKKGVMIVPPRYEEVDSFIGGIGAIFERDKSGKRHVSLIDRHGRVFFIDPREAPEPIRISD